MYANKIENRISFKIKTGHFLELLTTEAMKLLWSTENKIGENVTHLEITEVVVVHSNIFNNNFQ